MPLPTGETPDATACAEKKPVAQSKIKPQAIGGEAIYTQVLTIIPAISGV